MADNNEPAVWEAPAADQEWTVGPITEAPQWVDKGWASWAQGPAIAVPTSGLLSEGPYSTQTARTGDIIRFIAATPSKEAHFEVIQREPTGEGNVTLKPPAATNASLEDMLKGGTLTPDDLSDEARGQVLARSPRLTKLIEEGRAAPEPVPVSELLKIA